MSSEKKKQLTHVRHHVSFGVGKRFCVEWGSGDWIGFRDLRNQTRRSALLIPGLGSLWRRVRSQPSLLRTPSPLLPSSCSSSCSSSLPSPCPSAQPLTSSFAAIFSPAHRNRPPGKHRRKKQNACQGEAEKVTPPHRPRHRREQRRRRLPSPLPPRATPPQHPATPPQELAQPPKPALGRAQSSARSRAT